MSERKIMSLALKVLGFYCIILSVIYFQAYISTLSFRNYRLPEETFDPEIFVQIGAFIGFALLVILSCLFLIKSNKWAGTLYPNEETIDLSAASPQIGWYELILMVIGITLLLRTFPSDLIKLGSHITSIIASREYPTTERIRYSLISVSIQLVFHLCLGFYLVFGSKGLARFLYKIRGRSPQSAQE